MARLQIMIVDDDASIRMMLAGQLKHLDVSNSPHKAVDGFEAVKYHEEFPLDLIFMDVQMPKMTGLEATKKIREYSGSSQRARCVIIGLTGTPNRDRCLMADMDDFLLKPAMLSDIREMVDKWFPAATGN